MEISTPYSEGSLYYSYLYPGTYFLLHTITQIDAVLATNAELHWDDCFSRLVGHGAGSDDYYLISVQDNETGLVWVK